MPLGVFVPARAEDLSLSFATGVDSAAQGAVLYRSAASRYTPLAAGTAGQALVTGGVGANPAWSTDVAGNVTLTPSTTARNTIVSQDAGIMPLVVKGAVGQTNDLQEWQDGTGGTLMQLMATGLLQMKTASVQPAADAAAAFVVKSLSGAALITANTDAASTAGVQIARPNLTMSAVTRYRGLDLTTTITDAAPNASATFDALELGAFYNAAGTLSTLYGGFFSVRNLGSGTVTNLIGLQVGIVSQGAAGTVGTGTGIVIAAVSKTGALTTAMGLDVGNQGAAGMTTSYGIRVRAQSGSTNAYGITTQNGFCGFGTETPVAQVHVQTLVNNQVALISRGQSGQTADLLQCQTNTPANVFTIGAGGIGTITLIDATTNVVTDSVIVDHTSSGTPAAGFGQGLRFRGKSSTTVSRDMGRIDYSWVTATDASRTATACFWATDATADRMFLQGATSGTAAQIGFLGATPVARPAAYTQTYATATRTHANPTSADLTGITSSTTGSALAEPGASYAQAVQQQNFRRIQDQYNALRADLLNLKQVVNQIIDDEQAYGLMA